MSEYIFLTQLTKKKASAILFPYNKITRLSVEMDKGTIGPMMVWTEKGPFAVAEDLGEVIKRISEAQLQFSK